MQFDVLDEGSEPLPAVEVAKNTFSVSPRGPASAGPPARILRGISGLVAAWFPQLEDLESVEVSRSRTTLTPSQPGLGASSRAYVTAVSVAMARPSIQVFANAASPSAACVAASLRS